MVRLDGPGASPASEPALRSHVLVVTGAAAAMGRAYLDHFASLPGWRGVGVTRRRPPSASPHAFLDGVDLLDADVTSRSLQHLAPTAADELVLVHAVGAFAFEADGAPKHDADCDGIDDTVYHSNVTTFVNIATALLELARSSCCRLTLCAFGSVADKYRVRQWQSYTRSKDLLRGFIRRVSALMPGSVRGVIVNVSTTDTGNERTLRPYADARYWLTPSDVVTASAPYLTHWHDGWVELDVVNTDHAISPEEHYAEERVLARWYREMGIPR
ncbi:SDR family oxidoreductase [Pendulispora brunnea]|uniref:SDR family oxidoreductase n=1 Tax=Pendulispora brunnea TaxID=2905690 RepID=A0ABZ2K028_9BACT